MKNSQIKAKKSSHKKSVKNKNNTHNLEKEINGRGGLDPTRYGHWEKNGRCIDF